MLKNFEQRWQKAIKWWKLRQYLRKATHHGEDALLKLERIPWILSPSLTVPDDHHSLWVSKDDDPASWHVQVLLDSPSTFLFFYPVIIRALIYLVIFVMNMNKTRHTLIRHQWGTMTNASGSSTCSIPHNQNLSSGWSFKRMSFFVEKPGTKLYAIYPIILWSSQEYY